MAKPRTPLSQISYGLYVIGTRGREGDHAMTANWLTQVSFEPEMVALAVEKEATTRQLIDESKAFAVSILKSGQKDARGALCQGRQARHGGTPVRDEDDRRARPGRRLGLPDCRVVDSKAIGDHVIFFGKVVDSGMLDEKSEPLTLHETGWRYGG